MNPYKTHGAISWPELQTSDPGSAVEFYKSVFGWSIDIMPMPSGDYHVGKSGPIGHCGIMQVPDPSIPNNWSFYITTSDVLATIALAKELGGTIIFEPMEIPTVGLLAGIMDPTGAVIMAIQYADNPVDEEMPDYSFATHATTPGMFSWFELRTGDIQAASDFYSKLFGWTISTQEMPNGLYLICNIGGTRVAGIVEPMEKEIPPHWGAYITVDDLDETNAKIKAAGGTISVPSIPIEVGTFNVFQDPTGAWLSAIKYNPMDG